MIPPSPPLRPLSMLAAQAKYAVTHNILVKLSWSAFSSNYLHPGGERIWNKVSVTLGNLSNRGQAQNLWPSEWKSDIREVACHRRRLQKFWQGTKEHRGIKMKIKMFQPTLSSSAHTIACCWRRWKRWVRVALLTGFLIIRFWWRKALLPRFPFMERFGGNWSKVRALLLAKNERHMVP